MLARARKDGSASDGRFIRLAGAYSHYLLDACDKNLAIANFACPGGVGDCFDNSLNQALNHGDFEFYFREKVHYVFGPPGTARCGLSGGRSP